MNCRHAQRRIADHLDGLLGARETARLDAHLEACPACAETRDLAASARDRLHAPFPVPPLPANREVRILALAGRRAVPVPRRARLVWSCATSFAAGVLVTLAATGALGPESRVPATASSAPALEAPPTVPGPAYVPHLPPPLLRIR